MIFLQQLCTGKKKKSYWPVFCYFLKGTKKQKKGNTNRKWREKTRVKGNYHRDRHSSNDDLAECYLQHLQLGKESCLLLSSLYLPHTVLKLKLSWLIIYQYQNTLLRIPTVRTLAEFPKPGHSATIQPRLQEEGPFLSGSIAHLPVLLLSEGREVVLRIASQSSSQPQTTSAASMPCVSQSLTPADGAIWSIFGDVALLKKICPWKQALGVKDSQHFKSVLFVSCLWFRWNPSACCPRRLLPTSYNRTR